MWTYILRRLLLMIPTLFGVTIVAFLIMQFSPGDPLKMQLGLGGTLTEAAQSREAYLIQKRDLKLDKPLVLNFNYFRNYRPPLRAAAWYMSRTEAEVAAELPALAEAAGLELEPGTAADDAGPPPADPPPAAPAGDDDAQQPEDGDAVEAPPAESPAEAGAPPAAERLAFLERLRIPTFQTMLADPEQHDRLAAAVGIYVQTWCEDIGLYAVPAAIEMLEDPETPRALRAGTIRALANMVPEPFRYTYSVPPREAETVRIVTAWETWWRRNHEDFPQLEAAEREQLEARFAELVHEESRGRLFAAMEEFQPDQMRFFVEKLLAEDAALEQRVVASLALRLYLGQPLRVDVPRDAEEPLIAEVTENWLAHYRPRQREYEPSLAWQAAAIVADTQYAHMLWRLVRFDFGRSAVRTREPVAQKVWEAFLVSAPIMLLAQALIYLVAVPLGIVCSVYRNQSVDRVLSLGLFVLYSIPAYVAGMIFLMVFSFGIVFQWFPMHGLHSPGAEEMGWIAWTIDYLWHITLPVICLSLFSLAGMAMYSRSAMLDVLGQDYIRTARAKGLAESSVILKHGLRNGLIPIITLFANFLPAMLGGSVIIEYLFGIPGMGRLSWESILLKDFPTLMALIYIQAIVVMLSILLSDLLYVAVDPRIGFESQEAAA